MRVESEGRLIRGALDRVLQTDASDVGADGTDMLTRRDILAAGGAAMAVPFVSIPNGSAVGDEANPLETAALRNAMSDIAPVSGLVGRGKPVETLKFKVFRDGNLAGYHRMTRYSDGELDHVDIDVKLEMGLGSIVLYRYEHRNIEVWRKGKLRGFESRTNDDGERYRVSARRIGDKMRIRRHPKENYEISDILLPTTYWRAETTEAERLLDTQKGRVMDVTCTSEGREMIEARGRMVEADRYRVDGDLWFTIWYDSNDRWSKLAFTLKGSDFEFLLV